MTALMLREPAPQYSAGNPIGLREHDLSKLWAEQRFPKTALVTPAGERVHIVYRGRAGAGPGPDFRDAVISLPGRLAQGDIELHVRTTDFRRHGHHHDHAYDGVVLHVVLFHDEDGDTTLASGTRVPVVALGELLLHPRKPLRDIWREPCRDSEQRLGATEVAETLERLGRMRFRQKAAAWTKRLAAGEPAEEALWSGVLEALGYGGEREALRALATTAPWRFVRRELLSLPAKARAAAAMATLAAALDAPRTTPSGLRPANRATVRTEGAAALAARFSQEGIGAALLGPLATADNAPESLLRVLTVPRLIGRTRAIEIAANVVLPIAAALCSEPAARRYETLFCSLPLPARYGAVRHLHEAAAGITVTAACQQGMLYLLRQYCSQGGCGKCPLS